MVHTTCRNGANTLDAKKLKIKAKWSKKEVTPAHNDNLKAGSTGGTPSGNIPDEAKVELVVETENVPNGTKAEIEIRHCKSDKVIKDGTLKDLEIKDNFVIEPKTGKKPVWSFTDAQKPWDPFDKPYFYFKVKVDYKKLKAETPKDYDKKKDECLRVLYWHVCFVESGSLSGVLPEAQNVASILNGVADSKATIHNTTNMNMALATYGSYIQNTYVFHQASHGNVRNRTSPFASVGSVTSTQPPDDVSNPSAWRSVVSMTPMPRFGDNEIKNKTAVPSAPRYLWYSSTCLTGWESSFADALIGRGCRNVIAFRRTIPDAEAPQMAQKFYTQWANDYKLDPKKIPDCFFKSGADHYDNMRPVLFGAGGGAISGGGGLSAGDIAAIAVAAVAVGVVIGVIAYGLLK